MKAHEFARQSQQHPLRQLPAGFEPDRPECIALQGGGPSFTVAEGIVFDCLVGAHNQARQLMTGFVTFSKGAVQPSLFHHQAKSLTVLEGGLQVEFTGREYVLEAMDNITIPAGMTHCIVALEESRSHLAMPTASYTQELRQRTKPTDAREHIVRFSEARRYQAGPNAEFIDFLNEELTPGIPMSGGYGLFQQGGRLPAHIHDFDESICIVQGSANCNVEGRRHPMSAGMIALQPRGRIHYFINEAPEPMAMLWVYAGARPERILIEEAAVAR